MHVSMWFLLAWCIVVGAVSGLIGYMMAANQPPWRSSSRRRSESWPKRAQHSIR